MLRSVLLTIGSLGILAGTVEAGPLPAAQAPRESGIPLAASPYALLLRTEATRLGLPPEIADAVMAVESGYDPTRIGTSGEIGLMQVMPSTAAMLGFRGTNADLAIPATNVHFGVLYLSQAWTKAGGNLCRALMKYRAGHGEEVMSPLSVTYCSRAREHLAGLGSPYAGARLAVASLSGPATAAMAGGRIPKLNKHLRGSAFWAVQEARVRALTARVHRRWSVLASR